MPHFIKSLKPLPCLGAVVNMAGICSGCQLTISRQNIVTQLIKKVKKVLCGLSNRPDLVIAVAAIATGTAVSIVGSFKITTQMSYASKLSKLLGLSTSPRELYCIIFPTLFYIGKFHGSQLRWIHNELSVH